MSGIARSLALRTWEWMVSSPVIDPSPKALRSRTRPSKTTIVLPQHLNVPRSLRFGIQSQATQPAVQVKFIGPRPLQHEVASWAQ